MKKSLIFLLTICLIFASIIILPVPAFASTQQTYYVSPSGSDNNPGTINQPFLTITKARDVVRTVNSSMTGDIIVYLRGGSYNITNTISLDSSDSGTNGHNIIYRAYPGETPVVSGGTTVTGWQPDVNGIYKANVGTSVQTRQLYVNGIRKIRARGEDNPLGFTVTSTGYTLPSSGLYSNMANWSNKNDIQFLTMHEWIYDYMSVSSISAGTVTMSDPGWTYSNLGKTQKPLTRVENAYELLDQENEWYLNRTTGWLYYKPTTAEGDLSNATVIVPTLETLLSGTGTLGNVVQNVQFDGITFEYNTWLGSNGTDGYAGGQAGSVYAGLRDAFDLKLIPAAVTFGYAQNVSISNCIFTHLGNGGLDFGRGCHNNIIDHNVFTDISGIALQLGRISRDIDHHPSDEGIKVKDNTISNNTIHGTAVEYGDSVGLFVGYTVGTTVTHNTLYDLPYSAMNIGWGWGHEDTYGTPVAGNNVISYNRIYDYMKVLFDGGGIYTLGSQKNSYLYNNYLSGQHNAYSYIYHDNGTQSFHDTNNVIDSTGGTCSSWYLSAVYSNPAYYSSYDNISRYNYYSDSLGIQNYPPTVIVGPNIPVSGNNWSADAVEIMNNAGVDGGSGPDPLFGELNINLALNKTATASNYYQNNVTYNAAKAVDGSTGTRWATDNGIASANLDIDFGTVTFFDTVVIKEYENRIQAFNIQYWNGSSWINAYSGTKVGSNGVFHFPKVTGSKLRLNITNATEGPSIWEFEVYDTTELGTINDTNKDITYSGFLYNGYRTTANDYKNDVHYATTNGSYFEYTFNGTGIDYIAPKGPGYGKADVYIDGTFQTTVDTGAANYASQQLIYRKKGLSSGTHTIKVVKKDGNYVHVDVLKIFDIYNDTSSGISYSGFSYSGNRGANDFNDDVHYSTANNSYAEFNFTGTGVEYLAPTDSNCGDADVYIDGVFKQTVSTSNTSYTPQCSVFSITDLTPGSHTIKIVKKSGIYVQLDAIIVFK